MSKAETKTDSASVHKEILSEGPKLRRCLLENNPVLSPSQLDQYFEAYADFYPDRTGLLWSRETHGNHIKIYYGKIFLLVSGVAASGKHALINRLSAYLPNQLYPLVTATTRPPRPNEKEGIDHYFYSLEEFRQQEAEDQFIETTPQNDQVYGTPKKSIDEALKQSKPIIVSDVEIGSGWPSMEKYVAALPDATRPKTVKVFVLPATLAQDYFNSWLPQHRPKDFDYRGKRAAWEIAHGADKAIYIVSNCIRKGISQVDIQARVLSTRLQIRS